MGGGIDESSQGKISSLDQGAEQKYHEENPKIEKQSCIRGSSMGGENVSLGCNQKERSISSTTGFQVQLVLTCATTWDRAYKP